MSYPTGVGRWRPYQICVLVAIIISGAIGMIDPMARATSIAATMSPIWELAWYSTAALSSLIALCGVLSNRWEGLLIERGGLAVLSCACVAYALAIFDLSGARGLSAGLILLAIAAANFFRIRQISHDLDLLSRVLDDTKKVEE